MTFTPGYFSSNIGINSSSNTFFKLAAAAKLTSCPFKSGSPVIKSNQPAEHEPTLITAINAKTAIIKAFLFIYILLFNIIKDNQILNQKFEVKELLNILYAITFTIE